LDGKELIRFRWRRARAGGRRFELASGVCVELLEHVCALGAAERIAERLAAYHEAGADSVAVVPSTAEDSGGREVFGAIATSSGLVERT